MKSDYSRNMLPVVPENWEWYSVPFGGEIRASEEVIIPADKFVKISNQHVIGIFG